MSKKKTPLVQVSEVLVSAAMDLGATKHRLSETINENHKAFKAIERMRGSVIEARDTENGLRAEKQQVVMLAQQRAGFITWLLQVIDQEGVDDVIEDVRKKLAGAPLPGVRLPLRFQTPEPPRAAADPLDDVELAE